MTKPTPLSEQMLNWWRKSPQFAGLMSVDSSLVSKWIVKVQQLEGNLEELLARVEEAEVHLKICEDQLEE
jgi:hypothetical protein